MRPIATVAALCMLSSVQAQLDDDQIEYLAHLTCEFSNAWTISDLKEIEFTIGGRQVPAYSAALYTPKTSHKGGNEGVSLFFFKKAIADSVEAHFASTEESTYAFVHTRSFVVVVAYFSSNGKFYDIYTRQMLKELQNYFTNWNDRY